MVKCGCMGRGVAGAASGKGGTARTSERASTLRHEWENVLCPSHVRYLEIGDAYDLSTCELTCDYSPCRREKKKRQEKGQVPSWVAAVRCPRNSNSNDCLSARVSKGIYEGEGCEAARAREGK